MFKKSLLILLFFAVFKNAYSSENLILEGNFFPEGIAISRNGDIYVGSLKHNKIVKFKNPLTRLKSDIISEFVFK